MQNFIRENIALVAAIVLPLVLAAIFGASLLWTRLSVEPPRHDFLVATNDYNPDSMRYDIRAEGGRLKVTYHPPGKNASGFETHMQVPRLWRVRVPGMQVEEIALPAPADETQSASIALPGLSGVTLQDTQPGPDGYVFSPYRSYPSNFLQEIFDTRSRYQNQSEISKNGRRVAFSIPGAQDGYYGSVRFVGWITQDNPQ